MVGYLEVGDLCSQNARFFLSNFAQTLPSIDVFSQNGELSLEGGSNRSLDTTVTCEAANTSTAKHCVVVGLLNEIVATMIELVVG